MLTGRIPDWGFHRDDFRHATHQIEVEIAVDDILNWGMLGYFAGDAVGERIPVLTGKYGRPQLIDHKHFGAAAASSGGVEMYHIVGVTPESPSLAASLGGKRAAEVIRYGKAEQRRTYETLNARGRSSSVDFVMLGCPHYSLDQVKEACRLLGRQVSENCKLWIFTSRAARAVADREGYTKLIRDAGGVLLTDTCSAIGQAVPPGTRVAALDSAKQTHYLPAIMGIEAWFGTTADCINAAVTGRWDGRLP
jgi:predicted aconitase